MSVRSKVCSDGARFIPGAQGVYIDPDWDAARKAPDVNRAVRGYDNGQFYIVYNKPQARWQIIAQHEGGIRLVKTWETDTHDYLPLSMKVYEWLVKTDFETVYGTRRPEEVDRQMRSREATRREDEERRVEQEVDAYLRYERHTFAKLHSRWQKQEAFDERMLYPNAGKALLG